MQHLPRESNVFHLVNALSGTKYFVIRLKGDYDQTMVTHLYYFIKLNSRMIISNRLPTS